MEHEITLTIPLIVGFDFKFKNVRIKLIINYSMKTKIKQFGSIFNRETYLRKKIGL